MHCKNGHILAGKNIRIEKNGYKRCRVCKRNEGRRQRNSVLTDDDPPLRGKEMIDVMIATKKKNFKPRTHCSAGHKLSDDNVFKRTDGYIVCRMCQRNKARIAKKLNVPLDAPPLSAEETKRRWQAVANQRRKEFARLGVEAQRQKRIIQVPENSAKLWEQYVQRHKKTDLCSYGHPRTQENTLLHKRHDGKIFGTCRTCHMLRMQEYRKRRSGQIDIFKMIQMCNMSAKELERHRISMAMLSQRVQVTYC